jgi:hypothetical protein
MMRHKLILHISDQDMQTMQAYVMFHDWNPLCFVHVVYFCVVCFLLGNSPASEFYMPTFRNTLSVPSSLAGRFTYLPMKMEQTKCSERRQIKFRRRGITQKKAYNVQNTAKVWNQEYFCVFRDSQNTSTILIQSIRRQVVVMDTLRQKLGTLNWFLYACR